MPSLLVHLLVPPLVVLATRRVPPGVALALLPLALAPDLDFFLSPHRALLHSVFLPAALGALAWRWRERGLEARALAALVGAFYLASHGLLDLFAGGVVPFWPLSDRTFFLDVGLVFDTRTLEPFPLFEPGSQEGVPPVAPLYEFLDGTQFGILVLVLATFGVLALRRAGRVRRVAVVVAPGPGLQGGTASGGGARRSRRAAR